MELALATRIRNGSHVGMDENGCRSAEGGSETSVNNEVS